MLALCVSSYHELNFFFFRVNKGVVFAWVSSAYAETARSLILLLLCHAALTQLFFSWAVLPRVLCSSGSEALWIVHSYQSNPRTTLGLRCANLANMVISGTGALGLLERSLYTATALGTWFTWKNRRRGITASGTSGKCRYCVCILSYILLQGLSSFIYHRGDGSYLLCSCFGKGFYHHRTQRLLFSIYSGSLWLVRQAFRLTAAYAGFLLNSVESLGSLQGLTRYRSAKETSPD